MTITYHSVVFLIFILKKLFTCQVNIVTRGSVGVTCQARVSVSVTCQCIVSYVQFRIIFVNIKNFKN